jgi:hypothetical protein
VKRWFSLLLPGAAGDIAVLSHEPQDAYNEG